jgi:WD40 repeat protein
VKDAHRFFVHSKDVIENYPLQTYHSALLFSPRGSLIRTAFQHEEPNWVTIEPDMSETWGSCLHTFEDSCSAVIFLQNFNQLALGLEDGMIKIWDADSNTYLMELKSFKSDYHIERVRYFDESSKLVAVLGEYEIIEVWEVATGTCLSTQEFEQGVLHQKVPFCNDAELRAFEKATMGDSARILDTAEARESSILMSPHHDGRFKLNATFFPSGIFLLVNFKTNIKIWDATSSRHIQSLELPVRNEDSDSTFVASAWVSDSALLAVGLSNGTVIVFSIDSGDVLHILQSGDPPGWDRAKTVAISYDSKRVATPSGLSNLRIWDLSDTSNPHTLVGNSDDEIIFVAFLSDSRRLVSMSLGGGTKVWDICGEDVSQRLDDHQDWINSLTWSNDSNYLASGAFDSTIKIWDLHGRCLQTLHGHSESVIRVDCFHHPARVGSLSRDNTYRIWDVVSGQCLYVCEWGGSGTVIALSPDLRILARTKGTSTTSKWPIQLWDLIHDVSLPALCDDSAAHIRSLAFSGDSTQLAVLVDDKIVRIFDTRSGECVQTLVETDETDEDLRYSLPFGHYSVTFSKDAIRLVSAWGNGTIRVWDISSGRCLHTIETAILSTDVSFDQSGWFLLTDYGRIAIPESSDLEGNLAGSINHSPASHGVGLSPDGSWITYNSFEVLWLPPEY